MQFLEYLRTVSELTEARGQFKYGGYAKRKIFVGGTHPHQSYRYFKTKQDPKSVRGQINNEGWESKPHEDSVSLNKSFTVSKENQTIHFESESERTKFHSLWGDTLSYHDVHKLANPLNLPGIVKANITNDGALKLHLYGSTKRDAQGNYVNPNTIDIKERYAFVNTLRKNKSPFSDGDYLDMTIDTAFVPETMRNQGLLRKHMQASLPLWDSLGVKEIDLTANIDHGGYAWAKYGFDFKTGSELSEYTNAFKNFSATKNRNLLTPISHAWDIANAVDYSYDGEHGIQIGKEFMLDYSTKVKQWHGVLDLEHGSPGRIQLESYLANKVLPEFFTQIGGTPMSAGTTLTPEKQLADIVRDKVHNPIISGGGWTARAIKKNNPEHHKVAHEEYTKAVDMIKSLLLHGRQLEPGLYNKLHQALKREMVDLPDVYKSQIKPTVQSAANFMITKSLGFSEKFSKTLQEEKANYEAYDENNIKIFKNVAKVHELFSSDLITESIKYTMDMDVYVGNLCNNEPLKSFKIGKMPNGRDALIINPNTKIKDLEHRIYKKLQEHQNKVITRYKGNLPDHEKEIKSLPYERGYAIRNGKIVLMKNGTARRIHFTDDEIKTLTDSDVFTHNHPSHGGTTFKEPSIDDLIFACTIRTKEMRAVPEDGPSVYSLKPPDGNERFTPEMIPTFVDSIRKHSERLKQKYLLSFLTKSEIMDLASTKEGRAELRKIKKNAEEGTYLDDLYKAVAKDTGLKYEKHDAFPNKIDHPIPQGAVPILVSLSPEASSGVAAARVKKPVTVMASTKDVKALRKAKDDISANGYKEEDVKTFLDENFKLDNYSSLQDQDNVYLVMPSTSGKNILPKRMAERLQKQYGGEIVENFARPMAKLEAKSKGFVGKIRDPQSYELKLDLSKYKGKNIIIVDDVLNTGESQTALKQAITSHGITDTKTAVIGASETRVTSQRDMERIAQKISDSTGDDLAVVKERVSSALFGSYKQFANYAEKEMVRTKKNMDEIYKYIIKKYEENKSRLTR